MDTVFSTETIDTVVIGAGVSGLVAARRLAMAGQTVRLLEQSDRPGGLMGTRYVQASTESGYWVETGPHSFPGSAQHVLDLCQSLGLTPTVLEAKNRYLALSPRQLTLAPSGPVSAVLSSVLSPAAKLRLLTEPFQPASTNEQTVAQFVRQRFGSEVLTNLVAPLLTGIYAGDVDQLSAAAVMPTLVDWTHQHGSILKGALSQPRRKKASGLYPRRAVLGFPLGMQTLVDGLVQSLPPDVLHCGVTVQNLTYDGTQWRVALPTGALTARRLVLATPAYEASRLLRDYNPLVAEVLAAIPYSPVTVLHFGLDRQAVRHSLKGFGFLAAPKSQLPLLGCIFASTLFPNRAPAGKVLLTVLVGGSLQPELTTLPDEQLVPHVWRALQPLLGLGDLAGLEMLHRIDWPNAIPQLTLGHTARWQTIQQAQVEYLQIIGNFGKGIALEPLVQWASAVYS